MVEVNYGQRRPEAVVALNRVPELKGWQRSNGTLSLGAGLTYTEMADPALASFLPALRDAARTVGSPQIRNAGTIGGNLGTASPAGDTLPVLSALDATVALSSGRRLPLDQFITGPKRTARDPGELITAIEVPVLRGPQAYLKVGTRNAMVIAVCALALVVDGDGERVRCALGSVGPVPIRARQAEDFISGQIDWSSLVLRDPASADRFGELVAAASRPIDDHRSTADYRRHAVGVLARRALLRTLGRAS
jgi:CO/xanthine dehydrogenase FAD-binding subunit